MIAVDDVIDPETGEVYLDAGKPFTDEKLDKIIAVAGQRGRRPRRTRRTRSSSTRSHEDAATDSHEAALLKIYQRLRPGNPPQLEKAKRTVQGEVPGPNRYRLGRVGRFRINRKFDQNVPETEMTLRSDDFVNSIKYMLELRAGEGRTSTTSTTWATAGCARSTNWPPTNCARASSSSAAPCRSAWRSATSRT